MSDGGKRNKLPQLVIRALIDGGKTIEQIISQQNLKNMPAGDPDQIQHQSKSIWHNKAEIDNYVRDKLNIGDSEWYAGDSNRPSNWYTFVAQEISKLRDDGTITDWNPKFRTGIWRLTHLKGISSVDPALQSNTLNVDSDDSSSKRFFIALGPWSNWDHTIQNPPFRWGVNPSSASNVGVFNALRAGDVVYYYANQDNPRKFSKRGLFGVGIVTRIYDEDHERYWPDEKLKDEVIYKHRFEIKSLKLVTADSGLLPWIDGLPFTKGLNRVANEETLKQLIDSTQIIWNIDLKSNDVATQKNYFVIKQNPDSAYDDIPGKQYAYDSWKQHSSDFSEETKFIVLSNLDGTNYFVGHGTVDRINSTPITVNGRNQIKKVALFKDYVKFDQNRIQTEDMKERMFRIAYPNSDNSSRPPSMLPIPEELYNEIIGNTSLMSKDTESTLQFLSSKDIDDGYDEISKELLISKDKIIEILTALLSGRHVLLAGPIGTGKTRLAMDIPPIFWKKWGGYDAVDHTATSDWSTLDVIGGILPKVVDKHPTYQIQDGCVVSTVKKNSEISTAHSKYSDIPYAGTWLVIDEFNRAEIDKAFGQLFTALRTQNLKIPTITSDNYEDLKILKDYRIIGTLNTADKHFLFNLSDALKSRFAYIEVDIPTREQFKTEIYFAMRNALKDLDLDSPFDKVVLDDVNKKIIEDKSDADFYRRVMQAYYVLDTVRIFKKLGPAVLKLIYQNLIVGTIISQDSKKSLDNSLTSNLIPQLEHESSQSLEIIRVLHTADSLNSFITKAYDVQSDRESYLNSFEKLFGYLGISNKDMLLLDFKNGNLAQDDQKWDDVKEKYSTKIKDFELSLTEWPIALTELIKSKVF